MRTHDRSAVMMANDVHCAECADRGYVRDWYADTETGYRACTRAGCHVAEEIAAAVERELAQWSAS